MRIGELNYSGKATKLIAALMVCILVFTLAIPAQPAEAVAGTTVALAAGLTLAFVAACGVAFTVNEAQNSSTYWEGQIEDYMSENSYGSVDEWADFSQVTYNSGILGFPGVIVDALLSFFNWFTGKNGIEAGGSVDFLTEYALWNGYYVYILASNPGYSSGFDFVSIPNNTVISDLGSNGFTFWRIVFPYQDLYTQAQIMFCSSSKANSTSYYYPTFSTASDVGFCIGARKDSNSYTLFPSYWVRSANKSSVYYISSNIYTSGIDLDFTKVSYTVTASDVVGLPDLEEKETELGYVPDVNIPLPESVVADTNIGDINEAATAVLDYAGTAGNTLDLDYEYANTDTNVDTGTDTDTNEGTQEGTGTDAETGTQSGTLTLENVSADSLVDVAPETMLEDDTLLGLFISKFPWCIPFDLYYAIAAFAADPVAPEFEVNLFEGVSWEGLDLSGTEMTLSFEAFEKVAAVTRWSTLIIFCAGLAMITKRMIWS